MIDPYFQKRFNIPADSNIQFEVQGYSTLGMDITGTFTSGSFVLQGTVDGATWTTLETALAGVLVSGGTVSATGHYLFNCLGFNVVKLVPTALSATVVLSILGTVEEAAAFSDSSGGNPSFSSLTLPNIPSSILDTDANGLVGGVPFGSSGSVLQMTGTGGAEIDQTVWTGVRFITVGGSGSIYTSSDGLTDWTARASTSTAQLLAVCWSGTLAVAVGIGGKVVTSPDGVTWTTRTSGTANNLASVTWDGTNFIAVGSVQTVITSPDGITWTTRTFGTTVAIRGVASTTTLAVAVCAGGTIKTSTDHGVTWTLRTSGVSTTLWKVAVNALGTLWVAVGDPTSSLGVILTSPDGTTWTSRTSGAGNIAIENATFANSLWMAVGDGGYLATSSNGTTWTVQTSNTTSNLYGLAFGASIWLAVGASGTKITSPDAVTWTAQSTLVPTFQAPIGAGFLVLQSTTTAVLTLSGCSAGGTATARFVRTGNTVTMRLPDFTGTSNSTSGMVSGVPGGYIPNAGVTVAGYVVADNGVNYVGWIQFATDGTFFLVFGTTSLVTGAITPSATFTASGTKGISNCSVTYTLN